MSESLTTTLPRETQSEAQQKATYSCSPGLAAFLATHGMSVALSSYQSGKFYLLGRNAKGGLNVHERYFQKAMGLATAPGQIVLASLFQIIRFENALKPGELVNQIYDACFVPRLCHVTGVLDAHDVGITEDGGVIFVNTRFNCLAGPSTVHSFTPVWKPPFISRIIDEDRCHLNGLAMDRGRPRYVTAVSRSDTIDGWRDRRADGGVIVDVERNAVVCEGLSMPHSPRLYNGRLWVLNSGSGELGQVEMSGSGGSFKPLAFCPGFVRGLAFHGRYAFVGLSKPRYQRFEGLALDRRLQEKNSEAWCGLQVIDLTTGACVQWFRIDGAVGELYDVAIVPGCIQPMALGFASTDILSFITHEPLGAHT
ncbi:MAG: TIGR03032 family protein [Hyphomicrobiales bacterium]